MKILAVETSCDETAVAIIERKERERNFSILTNLVFSQIPIHKKFGGVVPGLAKRAHQEKLLPLLRQALKETSLLEKRKSFPKIEFDEIKKEFQKDLDFLEKIERFVKKYSPPCLDLLAVTVGPGLEPCLWQGINFVRFLSLCWNIEAIGVNHIEAHILANLIEHPEIEKKPKDFFPAICLVVSGGHTTLFLMEKIGKYKILGETRDDAAGECFDKVAKILGFSYPGGPIIEKRARKVKEKKHHISLPRPMIHSKDYDFSFSGLKTAVLYHVQAQPSKIRNSSSYKNEMAKEVQEAIIEVLLFKTEKAIKEYKAKSVIFGGGVVANKTLREKFSNRLKKKFPNVFLIFPPFYLCGDNAVMIGISGYFAKKQKRKLPLEANANLSLKDS